MNALVVHAQRPLRAFSVDEARKPLALLFAAYPEPYQDRNATHGEELATAKVNAYMLGLEGLPAWAIEQAVCDFIQGKVDRRRKGALPTPEEVAAEARVHVEREGSRQHAERVRAEQYAERRPIFPPEHRDRMGFKMSLLSVGLARRQVELVSQANERGLDDLIALGQQWGVPVPESLFSK